MTKQHAAPSKFEVFLSMFAAATGFSILFLFALSALVNRIDQTAGSHQAGTMQAHTAPRETPSTTEDSVARNSHPDTPAPTDKNTGGTQPATDKSAQGGQQSVQTTAAPARLAQLLAQANPKKGAKVAKKCIACHDLSKKRQNKVGPALYGVIGRKIATRAGFKYSPAMKRYAEKAGKWSYDNLGEFLQKPKKVVPKTKMAFAGIRKRKDLLNLIAWLRTNADQPVPLPQY